MTYFVKMTMTQQTFQNDKDTPIYISVEPWPECFELEPNDKLTLRYDASNDGDSIIVSFINECELVLWPDGKVDDIEILFNGATSDGRSWNFKHR